MPGSLWCLCTPRPKSYPQFLLLNVAYVCAKQAEQPAKTLLGLLLARVSLGTVCGRQSSLPRGQWQWQMAAANGSGAAQLIKSSRDRLHWLRRCLSRLIGRSHRPRHIKRGCQSGRGSPNEKALSPEIRLRRRPSGNYNSPT
jgi:hypothetical protein